MILQHVPNKDLTRTSQLLLLAAAALVLPISSQLAAQDDAATKETGKAATARFDAGSTKKAKGVTGFPPEWLGEL